MLRKNYIPLLLLSCILLGIFVYIFLLPLPQSNITNTSKHRISGKSIETSTISNVSEIDAWHIYTNAALGYMFEYPAAYDDSTQFQNCGINESGNGITVGSRSYIETDPDDGMTLVKFAQKKINEYQDADWKIEEKTNTTVGNERALSVDYRFGALARYGNMTFVHHDTYFYIFTFQAGAFACGDEPAVYDHILKTFKWEEYSE